MKIFLLAIFMMMTNPDGSVETRHHLFTSPATHLQGCRSNGWNILNRFSNDTKWKVWFECFERDAADLLRGNPIVGEISH